ncbi:copper oxidase [Actinomyces lilanjuaniae]|uniref:Copper-containing nitrite reductase n=1 Tax=Actinomyces lilanjuaniae TaxID=2321394 RepID=A0ABN5PQN5_9ACTO|nr:multicopper oxidase domain-containing protein [Actinomyces lilanjuaniae]AYD89387.1 copper oxidase [Actinomyces lilanjuaniae]
MTHRSSPAVDSPGDPQHPQDETQPGLPTPASDEVAPDEPEQAVASPDDGASQEGEGGPADSDGPDAPARRSAVTAGTLPAVGRGARLSARAAGSGKDSAAGAGGRRGEHGAGSSGRRGALLGLLTACAAVAAGGAAAVYRSRRASSPGRDGSAPVSARSSTGNTVEATVAVEGMRFVPDTVDVAVGDRLLITLDNTGDMVHDLVLETGATTGRVPAGQSAVLDAGVITSDTQGWCSVAGHRAQGMVFHVTVGSSAAAPDASDSQDSSQAPGVGAEPDAVADYEADLPEDFTAFDAVLPAAPADPAGPVTHRHTFTVTEKVMAVGGGVTQARMTFNGQVPGPVLRGSVGDTFEITLVNDGTMSHSIDFHAGITPPDDAMRSIAPGESLVYTFTAQHSGIWLYHCSTAPMSLHLASGMHGVVIIDPPGLGQVDREFVIVQSELYLGPEGGETSSAKVSAKTPDLMSFNGVAFQYTHQPLQARVGQRLRFWVLDAGPSLPSSFHIVGLQFDQVFLEGAWTLGGPSRIGAQWAAGSQALGLHPAQGGFVECVPAEPGHYVMVTHSFADMEKGARGVLHVTE